MARVLLVAFGVFHATACSFEFVGEGVPERGLYYPIDLEVSEDGRYVYVLNSNFDRRYNSGWLSVLDLDALLENLPNGKPLDALLSAEEGGVLKVLSLGGEMAIRTLPSGQQMGLISHRGTNDRDESMMTQFSIGADGLGLSCGDASDDSEMLTTTEAYSDCDSEHLLRIMKDGRDSTRDDIEPNEAIPSGALSNPYPVRFFDDINGASFAALGFLNSGWVRLYDVITEPNPSLVFRHGFDVAGKGTARFEVHPSREATFLSATSLASGTSRIYSLDIERSLQDDKSRFWTVNLGDDLAGTRMLGLGFSPDGTRAVVTNESPDSVLLLDSTIRRTPREPGDGSQHEDVWRPSYEVMGGKPLSGRPTDVLWFERTNGSGLIASCSFEDNRLYLMQTTGNALNTVRRFELDGFREGIAGVGEGPFHVAHVRRANHSDATFTDLLVVANFLDHSLTVIDVSSLNSSEFKVIAKVRDENADLD